MNGKFTPHFRGDLMKLLLEGQVNSHIGLKVQFQGQIFKLILRL